MSLKVMYCREERDTVARTLVIANTTRDDEGFFLVHSHYMYMLLTDYQKV
jgi:hypothetical protein